MELISQAEAALRALFSPYVNVLDQRNLLGYFGAALFVVLSAALVRALRRRRGFRPRALARLLARPSVWRHPSARLDYKLYAVSMVFMTFFAGYFVLGSRFWAGLAAGGIESAFGAPGAAAGASWAAVVLVAVIQVLAMDFGYWLGHYIEHKSPYLWEFHKIHHSAKVLTPATEYRQHPVEIVWMISVMGLTTGVAYAVTTHAMGLRVSGLAHVGFNLFVLAHLFTFHHIRHSHIDIPYTGVFGKLLHSPAHHRIHHSANPAHFDRNMGYIFSIWDWMAGTLHIPRKGERLTLGIGAEGDTHSSVAATMVLPFRGVARLLAQRWRPGSRVTLAE